MVRYEDVVFFLVFLRLCFETTCFDALVDDNL